MPRINIYIRKDDWDAWQAIEDKPGFIHDALSTKTLPPKIVRPPKELAAKVEKATKELIVEDTENLKPIVIQEAKTVITSKNKSYDFCKHDAVKGLCKMGCA